MATLKIDMCSACSFVIPTMQPAMTAADLFAQWMSSASHNTQASAPFLSTFSNSTTTLSSRTHLTTINATTVYHSSFHTAFCSNSTTTTTTTSGTHRPTANTSTICQLCVYTTSILSHFQHTTSQHSHARFSATTTLQRSHTQSPALTTTTWIIPQLPAYTTLNKHDTSTPVSQQFPTTTALTPPLSHNKHNRTRSRTTRKKHRYQQVFQFYNHNLSKHTTAWVHLHILAEQSQRSFDMQRHIRSSSTHSNHL